MPLRSLAPLRHSVVVSEVAISPGVTNKSKTSAHSQVQNILLRSNASEGRCVTVKIADFGLSLKMDKQDTHVSKAYQGTLTHMAPEVLLDGHQSKAADV